MSKCLVLVCLVVQVVLVVPAVPAVPVVPVVPAELVVPAVPAVPAVPVVPVVPAVPDEHEHVQVLVQVQVDLYKNWQRQCKGQVHLGSSIGIPSAIQIRNTENAGLLYHKYMNNVRLACKSLLQDSCCSSTHWLGIKVASVACSSNFLSFRGVGNF